MKDSVNLRQALCFTFILNINSGYWRQRILEAYMYIYMYIYIYIYMRRFREYTSNRHNISVALDPHGMLK